MCPLVCTKVQPPVLAVLGCTGGIREYQGTALSGTGGTGTATAMPLCLPA